MEAVPNTFPSLFWAYTVFWALLAAYIFSLARRLDRLERKGNDINIKKKT